MKYDIEKSPRLAFRVGPGKGAILSEAQDLQGPHKGIIGPQHPHVKVHGLGAGPRAGAPWGPGPSVSMRTP